MNTTFNLINGSPLVHQSAASSEMERAVLPDGSLPLLADLPEGPEGGGRAGQVLTGQERLVEPGKDVRVLASVSASGASFAVEVGDGSTWIEAGRWAINSDDAAAVRFSTDAPRFRVKVYMGNQAAGRVRAYSQIG